MMMVLLEDDGDDGGGGEDDDADAHDDDGSDDDMAMIAARTSGMHKFVEAWLQFFFFSFLLSLGMPHGNAEKDVHWRFTTWWQCPDERSVSSQWHSRTC